MCCCVCPRALYKNNSFAFLTEHAFLIARAAIKTIKRLIFLAACGHRFTQRIQEMHFLESVIKQEGSIACTGHFFAHSPQWVQNLLGFGTSRASAAFL